MAFRRFGYDTVEKLMGSDPFFDVTPIGPEPWWIEEVQEVRTGPGPGGVVTRYYRRSLDLPKPGAGYTFDKFPWRDVKGIGITLTIQTLEAIALWQEENAKERFYERSDHG